MPLSISPAFTDGEEMARFWKLRPFGMRSNSSAVTLWAMVVLLVSMSGDSVVTVTASCRPPTASVGLSSMDLPSSSVTSDISDGVKPASSNFTV